MNLQTELSKPVTKAHIEKLVRYIGKDATRFKMLIDIFSAGPYRITQRAAWPLSICLERFPELSKPHIRQLVAMLDKQDAGVAVKRNVMRVLQHVELPQRLHGKIADKAFQYITNNGEAIAVRVFSMTVLGRLAEHNPEIGTELRLIMEDHLPFASPAYLSRARKLLKTLPQ